MEKPGQDPPVGKGLSSAIRSPDRQERATWAVADYVFSRPVLAAGIVGLGIHILLAANDHFAIHKSYFGNLWADLGTTPLYGFIKILVPFFVPFVITTVARMLNQRKVC